jgi:dihydroflavonol-4-reductase
MVFITGCNGLIGSFVARKCIQEGIQVKALKRKSSDLSLIQDIADKIEWIDGDILDLASLAKSISAADQVVHAAAVVSFSASGQGEMFSINVEGTANVINTCLAKGVKKLCFVSSVASIGRKKNIEVISEQTKWDNSSDNTQYAKTKYLAELEVWRGIAEGLQAVIVNPSVVLGPGNWHKSSTQLFKYVWDQQPFYTEGNMNYVDVRDVADIIFKLIHSEITSERFILNAGSIAYKEIFDKIAQAFDKKKPYIKVSPWMASIAWRAAYIKGLLTGSKPLITKETAQMAQKSHIYSNKKIKNTIGYEFKNIDETIDWTCRELIKSAEKNINHQRY